MAGAMLDGWIAAGLSPARFLVMNPSPKDLPAGVKQVRDLPSEGEFGAILVGVKPQKLADVAPAVDRIAGGAAILSILAGVQLDTLAERFPHAAAHVRVMPNLAVALGKSPVALAATGLDEEGRAELTALIEPLGTPEWIGEDAFDLVTALAGSGPAFVYRFIDALAGAAAELGLPREQADALALAMVEGAASLAAKSPHDPGELARRVASPGGVTQAGLDVLDQDGAIANLLEKTLRSARDRSAQMAAEARQ